MNKIIGWIDSFIMKGIEYIFRSKDISNYMIKIYGTLASLSIIGQASFSFDFEKNVFVFSNNPYQYFDLIPCVFFSILMIFVLFKNKKDKEVAICIKHCNFKSIKDESLYKIKDFSNYLLDVRKIEYDPKSDKLEILNTIKEQQEKISFLIKEMKIVDKILYCGVSPIPFSFYFGYLMRKSLEETQVFEYNDSKGDWNKLKKGDCNSFKLTNDLKKLNNGTDSDIVLLVSVSFPISKDSIPNHLKKHPCINISVEEPKRECIDSYEKIENIRKEFKETLDSIKTKYPKNKTVHLFLSTPDSLTFVLGKTINENMHSNLYVYGFNQGVYDWYVNINNENIDFLNKNDDKV